MIRTDLFIFVTNTAPLLEIVRLESPDIFAALDDVAGFIMQTKCIVSRVDMEQI